MSISQTFYNLRDAIQTRQGWKRQRGKHEVLSFKRKKAESRLEHCCFVLWVLWQKTSEVSGRTVTSTTDGWSWRWSGCNDQRKATNFFRFKAGLRPFWRNLLDFHEAEIWHNAFLVGAAYMSETMRGRDKNSWPCRVFWGFFYIFQLNF